MDRIKFKTNIKCDACIQKVTPGLNNTIGEGHWHVDITKPEKTLTVDKDVDEAALKEALQKVGYRAERL